jgi:hypothetical protein
MNYIKSWFGYSDIPGVSEEIKTTFTDNVVPEIEKHNTNIKKRKMVKQLNRTPIKQRSVEKMEEVKTELLKAPKKTYVVIEDRKTFSLVPRVPALLERNQVNIINKNKLIRNHRNDNYKLYSVKKTRINQPKSRNGFKKI